MKRRRVKITGVGVVCPAGVGIDEFTHNLAAGRSFTSAIHRFPKDSGDFVAAEVKKFNIEHFAKDIPKNRVPRHTQFALAASVLALKHAGIELASLRGLSPSVITGTSLMDSEVINKTIQNVAQRGPRHALARVVFEGPVSSVSSHVANFIGGANTRTIQSACCSGLDAIGHGAEVVSCGESDLAICGGSEAPIFYHPMLELRMAGLSPGTAELPEDMCRPFDLWRTTGVIGEGACICIIEPEGSPRRGLAYVRGYGQCTDHPSNHQMGLPQAIRTCLSNAGARPSDVSAISAWGPGHKEIDAMEARAIQDVFGKASAIVPVFSIKGSIGNPFAAAGALQVGSAVSSLVTSLIPPTVNWSVRDPECDLCLSSRSRYIKCRNMLVNAHGVSGTNSCMLLERCN